MNLVLVVMLVFLKLLRKVRTFKTECDWAAWTREVAENVSG